MHWHLCIRCGTSPYMRTTLDIDDDIRSAAKELGKAEGRTMGEVISDLARHALTQPASGASGFAEPASQFLADDWAMCPRRDGPPVTNELIRQIRDELDMEDATPYDFARDAPRRASNGFLRICTQKAYSSPIPMADAITVLRRLTCSARSPVLARRRLAAGRSADRSHGRSQPTRPHRRLSAGAGREAWRPPCHARHRHQLSRGAEGQVGATGQALSACR